MVRESFRSHGSSLSKDTPMPGAPGNLLVFIGILSLFYARGTGSASLSAGVVPPRKVGVPLKSRACSSAGLRRPACAIPCSGGSITVVSPSLPR
jgi:hypothetical protein